MKKNKYRVTYEGGPDDGRTEDFDINMKMSTKLNYLRTGSPGKVIGTYSVVSLIGNQVILRWKKAKDEH